MRRQKTSTALRDTTTESRATVKRRVLVAAVFLGLWAVGIQTRLVYLQVYAHGDLKARAERQQQSRQTLPAERGQIVDRKGRVLATSAKADTIIADPTKLEDPEDVITRLCALFRDCTRSDRATWRERFKQTREFVYVRRHVTADVAAAVKALNLPGVGVIQESQRFYPKQDLAAHVLGFVGTDGKGLEGLEAAYDSKIRGEDGWMQVWVDVNRKPFSRVEQPPKAGSSLELTIDENLQHVAQRELREGVRRNRARGGSVIILDPKTNEVLAMANEPTFNPNEFGDAPRTAWRNRAVQDLYEPGSTFKIITASAALEERVMPPDRPIDVSGGRIRIGKSRVVQDDHVYGTLSFTDVIVKSSNVGAIKIGQQVGAARLGSFVQRFGFGRPVSRDFPGENGGLVWNPSSWNESTLASVSMGYEIGVTPLQMAAAVSSIANGGNLIVPRIVRAMEVDGERIAVPRDVVRQTVSPQTAATLTTILEGVVQGAGTATAARIPGYTIAGKTGTAAQLVNGRYSTTDYNASFVGFLPSRDPVATIIVVIDSPRAGTYYGGTVAAPIFQRIGEATLRHFRVPPSINRQPPVLVNEPGGPGIRPLPSSPSSAPPQLVHVAVDTPPGTLPDVHGMSAREATRVLGAMGVRVIDLVGDGFVVSQNPLPGSPLDAVNAIQLRLERQLASSDRMRRP